MVQWKPIFLSTLKWLFTKFMSVKMTKQHIFIIENNLQKAGQSFFHLSRRTSMSDTRSTCPMSVLTDIGQALMSRPVHVHVHCLFLLPSSVFYKRGWWKNDCPAVWRLFSMIKMCCFVIFTDINFVNNHFNVLKNIGFHWSTLSLIITVNQEIFRTYTWSVSFQRFD
jgi:hypothetical protein